MFKEIEELEVNKSKTLIAYANIQTTTGQSGSPILLRSESKDQNLKYQIVGVHTGFRDEIYNYGTFIENLSFDGLKNFFLNDAD